MFGTLRNCLLWASVRLSRVSVRTGFPVYNLCRFDFKLPQLLLTRRKLYETLQTTSVGMEKHIYKFPGWFDSYFRKSQNLRFSKNFEKAKKF